MISGASVVTCFGENNYYPLGYYPECKPCEFNLITRGFSCHILRNHHWEGGGFQMIIVIFLYPMSKNDYGVEEI